MLASVLAASAVAGPAGRWTPPSVTYSELIAGDAAAAVRSALSTGEGVLAVDGVVGLGAARRAALDALMGCAVGQADLFKGPHALADGSLRRTVAARGDEPLPAWVAEKCPELSSAAAQLRRIFDTDVAEAAVAAGKALTARSTVPTLLQGSFANPGTLADVLKVSPTLDHFHVYQPAAAPTTAALPLHTDAGLLLAMVPASGAGFEVQLRTGDVVEPVLRDDQLVLLGGAAADNWGINRMLLNPVRAAPHAVWLSGGPRAWYGRMWELPSSAADGAATYGGWRREARERIVAGRAPAAPNGHHAETLELASGQCADGEVLCWMACRPVPTEAHPDVNGNYCNSSVAFCSADGHTPVPGSEKGTSNKPTCPMPHHTPMPGMGPPPGKSSGDFCMRSMAMNMYMDGFKIASSRDTNGCVILLFKEWTLDTATKFGFACVGVFLLGFVTDMWMVFRSFNSKKVPDGMAGNVLLSLMFGVQLTLGYFAMLIIMIYSMEMFMCVIAGFMVSHMITARWIPAGGGPTACCGSGARVGRSASPVNTVDFKPLERAGVVVLQVEGMTCGSCARAIRKALKPLVADVDVEAGTVRVNAAKGADPLEICRKVENAGEAFSANVAEVLLCEQGSGEDERTALLAS